MRLETEVRAARISIPLAVIIGVLATVAAVWWTVADMALLFASQVANLRASQRDLDGWPPGCFDD